MAHFHSLISDLDIEIELLQNLKDRSIDQKHTYLNDGATIFYDSVSAPKEHIGGGRVNTNTQQFIDSIQLQRNEQIAFISLGCGNASQEYSLIKELTEEGYHITYIGVDISKKMLEMAEDYLASIDCQKQFICADFASPFFRTELNTLTAPFHRRVFAFLGSTIGNIHLTNIVDTLSNMLTSHDFLWIDMISRKGSTQADDLELFSYYSTYLDNPLEVESFIYPLKRVGVTLGDGSLNISMKKEESVGVLRFEFGFTFHRKVKLSFRNEKLIFLPGETVQLCDIRAYDVPKLISFFEEHEFQCVSSDTSNKIAQLYFQLKPTI